MTMAARIPLNEEPGILSELRLVLVGPGGDGKSSTGNTILGRRVFDDKLKPISQTQCYYATTALDDRSILVVDTPARLCSETSNEDNQAEIEREIAKCILLSSPGPHAILLVIRVARLPDYLPQLPRVIEDMFGAEAKRYIIIVLTGKDDLEYEEKTLDSYMANAPSYMSKMFKKFPVFAINNKSDSNDKRKQVNELLKVVAEQNKVHMSNALYESIEEIFLRAEGESSV